MREASPGALTSDILLRRMEAPVFAGVISRDNGTPWPQLGMTSARWLHIPTRQVRIAELTATQPGVLFAALTDHHGPPVGGDPLPHVIAWHGALYLEDGHHRVTRAALSGHTHIEARVLFAEPPTK